MLVAPVGLFYRKESAFRMAAEFAALAHEILINTIICGQYAHFQHLPFIILHSRISVKVRITLRNVLLIFLVHVSSSTTF